MKADCGHRKKSSRPRETSFSGISHCGRQRLHTYSIPRGGCGEGDNESSERVDDAVSRWKRHGELEVDLYTCPLQPGLSCSGPRLCGRRQTSSILTRTVPSLVPTLLLAEDGPQPSTPSTFHVSLSWTMCFS